MFTMLLGKEDACGALGIRAGACSNGRPTPTAARHGRGFIDYNAVSVHLVPQIQKEMAMGEIIAHVRSLNLSHKKGQRKLPASPDEAQEVREQWGIANDAHSGDWHRQVSILAWESIVRAQEHGLDVNEGDFAENFTTEGYEIMTLPMGTQLRIGDDVLVEISQIGKVCHARCAIYYLSGDCIFPREGIFGVVLQGGLVRAGDHIELVKLGDGTCHFSPKSAIDEVEAARAAGTL